MSWSEFKGTEQDKNRLLRAVERNCQCPKKPLGVALNPSEICPPHRMLIEQGVIDHLLFAKSLASRLRKEEFGPQVKRRW